MFGVGVLYPGVIVNKHCDLVFMGGDCNSGQW